MEPTENAPAVIDDESPKTSFLPEVTMETGSVVLGEKTGVISGNIYRGGEIRGQADLTIEGGVLGGEGGRCVIEMGGCVQINQSVVGAAIRGHSIIINGDASSCRLQSDTFIEVHGSFSDGQAFLGAQTEKIKRLNAWRVEERRSENRLREIKVQTSLNARKFLRDYPRVNLEVGQTLEPLRRELRVNLKPFYATLNTDDEEKIDHGLDEFYLRVVVGHLTRNNKQYISRNPSRQKIFLKLIEGLRRHIHKIREMDKLETTIRRYRRMGYDLMNDLKKAGDDLHFRVGGALNPAVAVQFVLYKGFGETSSGGIQTDRGETEGRLCQPDDGQGIALETLALDGEKSVTLFPEGLANGEFVASGGIVSWRQSPGNGETQGSPSALGYGEKG